MIRSCLTFSLQRQRLHKYGGTLRWHSTGATATSETKTTNNLVTMSTDHRGICTITLNRPQKLNALNIPMFVQLQSILHDILQKQMSPQQSSSIRVILVRGEGRAFCTGLDIPSIVKEIDYRQPQSIFQTLLQRHALPDYIVRSQQPPAPPHKVVVERDSNLGTAVDTNHEDPNQDDDTKPDIADAVHAMAVTTNLAQDISYLWRQIHVPVIGCVQGMCYGGGLQMILGMDLRYAQSDTTKLSIMESKWGLIPDMGASITLRELIAIDIAKELTFTGRVISGEEALRYGLVTKCVDDPVAEGYKLALLLVDQSPDVLRYSKQMFQQTYSTGRSEEECLQLENQYQNQLLGSYNQIVASLRTKLGWKFLPYWNSSSPISRK